LAERVGGVSLPRWPATLPVLLLAGLVTVGAAVLVLRGQWFAPLCFVSSVAVTCLAPWPEQFPRYLTPMVPFMALFVVVGATSIVKGSGALPGPARRAVFGILSAFLAGVFAVDTLWFVLAFRRDGAVAQHDAQGGRYRPGLLFYGPEWVALDESLDWVGR